MSYLIKQETIQADNQALIRKILSQIKTFMISELNAIPAAYQNLSDAYAFASTVKGKNFEDIQIYWLITFQKLGIKIRGIPSSLKSLGVDLVVNSQRLYIDLSKFLNLQNKRLKNKYKMFINEAQHLCIQIYLSYQQIQIPRNLDYILKIVTFEMKNILEDKLKFMQPYIPMFKSLQEEQVVKQHSTQQKIYNFIILNQIYKQHRDLAYQQNAVTDTTIFNKLNTFGQGDLKNLENMLNCNAQERKKLQQFLGLIFLKNQQKQESLQKKMYELKNVHLQFAKQKQKKSAIHKTFRNVYGVSDIQKISSQNQLSSNGSHSSLSIASYHFKILNTINTYFKEPKERKGFLAKKPVQNISLRQQETYLIKKICKNKQQLASFNSFKNQIQFICYIRDRFCKYISTYYWDTSKLKTNAQEIYMDYYPQNIYQFFMKTHQSQQIISFQNKIQLLQQILVCLNFLSENFICHRDVKLQNIMISISRQIKMIDFGSCSPIFGRKQFSVPQKRLLGTEQYHFPYDKCPQNIKQAYKIGQYQQHMLFDAYSFGTIIQRLMGKQDFSRQNNPIVRVQVLLYYIKQKCHEIDPVNRLTYAQMLYLFKLIKQILCTDLKEEEI